MKNDDSSLWSSQKFYGDIVWNAISFFILGVSGVILNFIVLSQYGSVTLGIFNQTYAVYIVMSQLAVFGFYASVLKTISQHYDNKEESNKIMTGSLIIVGSISLATSILYCLIAPWIGQILKSPDVAIGMAYSAPGLWFFAMNKVFLSFLNGKRLMKSFAIFQSIRYLLLVSVLVYLILDRVATAKLPVAFSISEAILFLVILFYSLKHFSFVRFSGAGKFIRTHLLFGAKTFLGGSIVELNSRVDILILGIFLDDKMVGIYSLAALLAEGMAQIPSIFRVNFNPKITKLYVDARLDELSVSIKKFLKMWRQPAIGVYLISLAIFPLVARLLLASDERNTAWLVFSILVTGVLLKSGYDVFWEIPSQTGHPGYQSLLIVSLAVSNIVLCWTLSHLWGIYGAASVLIINAVLGIMLLKRVVRRIIGLSI